MATSPEVVRRQLAVVTAAAVVDLGAEASQAPPERRVAALLDALPLVVPAYYDATATLAVTWYDELREDSQPTVTYAPEIIGDAETEWIDREVAKFGRSLDADLDREVAALSMFNEATRLAEKEVARGFRDSIVGNTRMDKGAIGWSRVTRHGACKFCAMLAANGAVYRSESTAIFAAHTNCHCAARPVFLGGEHGPEADVIQYEASSKRASDDRVQAARNAKVRAYLNKNYPDLPG